MEPGWLWIYATLFTVGDTGAPAGLQDQNSQSRLKSRLSSFRLSPRLPYWLRGTKSRKTWQLKPCGIVRPAVATLPHDLVILLLCSHPETEYTATPKPAHKCAKQHCSQQLKSKSNPNTTNGEWERHPWPAQEVTVF